MALSLEEIKSNQENTLLRGTDFLYKKLLYLVPNFCRKKVYNTLGINFAEDFNTNKITPFTNTTLDRLKLAEISRRKTQINSIVK